MTGQIHRSFFQRDPVTCARELIGCELRWKYCAGIIVETEAYAAVGDEACHTFSRPSARAFIARYEAGAAYVYFNYGMHWMLNVLVKGGERDGFVLFRAIEPTRGLNLMARRRFPSRCDGASGKTFGRSGNTGPAFADPHALCSGPGKLAKALGIDLRDHGRDLCGSASIGFQTSESPSNAKSDVRVGISKAVHLPWRFLAPGSSFLSARMNHTKSGQLLAPCNPVGEFHRSINTEKARPV